MSLFLSLNIAMSTNKAKVVYISEGIVLHSIAMYGSCPPHSNYGNFGV